MKRTIALFVVAWMLAGLAGLFVSQPARAEPTPGTQVHLPILTWLGDTADACDVVIEVQNVGNGFAKAAILFWGAPGACPPQCNGPFKVECSGLLKPGSSWNFVGPESPAQVPPGAKKGIVFSLDVAQVDGDIFADAVCEELFATVRQDCDEYRRFKKAFDEGLVWNGHDFDKNPGEPLAVEVVRKCQTETMDAPVVSAYSGVAGPMLGAADPVFGGGASGFMFYAPLLYADQDGLNSYIYIQNAGLECTSVEIWLKQQGECIRSVIDEIPALAPGETYQYNVSDLLGPFWQGNAWIRTSVPAAIVVDNFSDEVLMTYHGKPAELNFTFDPNSAFFTAGSQVNYAPLIYREHQGWNTNIQVQNLSSVVNAKVKVYFMDNSGDIIKTVVDWICPRGTQTFPLAVIDGLRGNWVGQARVESQDWWSPGAPGVDSPNIVSIAELIRWNGPEQTVLLEGVAYNLFPEQQAFDWQVGSGRGGLESGVGLIGIPSLLNNIGGGGETGLATELAIANLVPQPGFTDFSIYIYDQNGLLDFLCEKLGEKQVEYINVANDWNHIMDGFKGSAVISATFWEHDVFGHSGGYRRNLVGLAAVKVERFNWPQVPSTDPADDAPGDQASASEGFPIYGPWNYGKFDGFDFEGPSRPGCPGVGEDICRVTVQIKVTEDGRLFGPPVQGALVQLRLGNQPIATGVTDGLGVAVIPYVPVTDQRFGRVTYEIHVQPSPRGSLEQVGTIRLVRADTLCGQLLPMQVVRAAPVEATIAGTLFRDRDNDCRPAPGDIRFANTTVVLARKLGTEDEAEEVTTTNANGRFEFEDVNADDGPFQLKAVLDGTSFPSAILDDLAGDVTLNFVTDGDETTPGERWCEPGEALPPPPRTQTCRIAGTAFNDRNNDYRVGVFEPRWPFRAVLLVDANDDVVDTTLTGANGQFALEADCDATYQLKIRFRDVGGNLVTFPSPAFLLDGDYDGTDANQQPNFDGDFDADTGTNNGRGWIEPGGGRVNGP